MSKLDEVVFIIKGDKVLESTIRALGGYANEITTPTGTGPRLHVRENELWSGGHEGHEPRRVAVYASPEEAQEALEDTLVHDFWRSEHFTAFSSREDAETFLRTGRRH